jgi:hypothetical protein
MWPSGVWVVCTSLHDLLWVHESDDDDDEKRGLLPHPQQPARPIGPTNNDINQSTVNEVGPDNDE